MHESYLLQDYCGAVAFESERDAATSTWLGSTEILWAKLDSEFDGNLNTLRNHIVDLAPYSKFRPEGYIRVILIRGRTMPGSLILLNSTGDIVLEWSSEHEASMRDLIEKKIKEGYSFFIVKKVFGISRRVKVKSIDQIKQGAKLLLRDEDALRLFEQGKITASQTEKGELIAESRVENPDVILKNDCIAVKPIQAG